MSDTTLNRFIASGTTAERTAFTPSPPTPSSGPDPGYLWWDTDLQEEFAWDAGGAAWVSTGGGGSGTVTHTGTLTDHAVIVGNGSADVSALGSLGTTTQVLHGNASGDPAFSAVDLAADVTGDLPLSNLAQSSAASRLLGRGSASGAGDYQEVTLGSGLSMSGTTLSASGGSSLYPAFTAPPSAASFTGDNATGASITDLTSPAGLYFLAPARAGASDNIVYYKSMGGTTKLTVALLLNHFDHFPWFGVGWRESGSGKFAVGMFEPDGSAILSLWTTTSGGGTIYTNTNIYAYGSSAPIFFQFEVTGGNRIVRWSRDGQSWINIDSRSSTADLTPDQWCMTINPHNGTYQQAMTVRSWLEE